MCISKNLKREVINIIVRVQGRFIYYYKILLNIGVANIGIYYFFIANLKIACGKTFYYFTAIVSNYTYLVKFTNNEQSKLIFSFYILNIIYMIKIK